MSEVTLGKKNEGQITVVEKLKDYSQEPAFKNKAEKATTFLKKHGLPGSFTKK